MAEASLVALLMALPGLHPRGHRHNTGTTPSLSTGWERIPASVRGSGEEELPAVTLLVCTGPIRYVVINSKRRPLAHRVPEATTSRED